MPSQFTISPVDKVYRTYTGTFTDEDGNPVTLTSADVVLIPQGAQLTAGLTWTTVAITAGKLRLLLAGPLADQTGALSVLQTGCDVWARITDTPEIQAQWIDTITVFQQGVYRT